MKNIILILFFAPVLCYAQDTQGTTQEEYKYVTKGYQTVLENGMDAKAGYEVKRSTKDIQEMGGATLTPYILLRTNQGNKRSFAAIMLMYKFKSITHFYCIPNAYSDKSMFEQFRKDVQATNYVYLKDLLLLALTKLTSQETTIVYSLNK